MSDAADDPQAEPFQLPAWFHTLRDAPGPSSLAAALRAWADDPPLEVGRDALAATLGFLAVLHIFEPRCRTVGELSALERAISVGAELQRAAEEGWRTELVVLADRLAELVELLPAHFGDPAAPGVAMPMANRESELVGLAARAAAYIRQNPGTIGKNIACDLGTSHDYFRKMFSQRLRPLGFRNEGEGYLPPL